MSDKIIYNDQPRDPSKPYVESVRLIKPKPYEETLEGGELITQEDAAIQAAQSLTDDDPGIDLGGGVRTHSEVNILFAGQTRCGKTTAVKIHIAQVLKRIREGSDEKLILFDTTGEIIPFVYGHLGNAAPVFILNPADARCHAWNVGADVLGAASTNDLSHTFVQQKPHDTPFFGEGAQSLAAAVMDLFVLLGADGSKPIEWTLRDVIAAVRKPQRIRAILKQKPEYLEHLVEAFIERGNQDVYSSLQARTKELAIVAAMWDGRPLFSLREFFNSKQGGVLILGVHSEMRAVTLEMNRLILERAARILLSRGNLNCPRYWFFLDEFPELGRIESLKSLIKDGLKRGIRMHLIYQNSNDIRRVYEKEDASVIISELNTKFIFRQDAEIAKEASQTIGHRKIRRFLRNYSTQIGIQNSRTDTIGHSTNHSSNWSTTAGPQGGSSTSGGSSGGGSSRSRAEGETYSANISTGKQEQIVFEPIISDGELQYLEKGAFYCLSPSVKGTWKYRYNRNEIAKVVECASRIPEHAPFIARTLPDGREDPKLGYLRDWTQEDLTRLGLPSDILERERPKTDGTEQLTAQKQPPPEEESSADRFNRFYDKQKLLADALRDSGFQEQDV